MLNFIEFKNCMISKGAGEHLILSIPSKIVSVQLYDGITFQGNIQINDHAVMKFEERQPNTISFFMCANDDLDYIIQYTNPFMASPNSLIFDLGNHFSNSDYISDVVAALLLI